MLERISIQSLTSLLLILLIILTIGFYIFPGHDSFFILFASVLGAGPFLVIAAIIVLCITISIIKLIIQNIKR